MNIPGYTLTERIDSLFYNNCWKGYSQTNRIAVQVIILSTAGTPKGNMIQFLDECSKIKKLTEATSVPILDILEMRGQIAVIITLNPEEKPLADHLTGAIDDVTKGLQITLQLVKCLEELQKNSIVHRTISPYSIAIDPELKDPRLFYFGASLLLQKENWITGESSVALKLLPFISPQQTGRASHEIDWRTDYYSLGAVLYLLFTGKQPFEATDALAIIHKHLAYWPSPPLAINNRIPKAVSDIIMKLLEKDPAERYQSAQGLRRDIERCLEYVEQGIFTFDFTPGQTDVPQVIRIPDKRYGRDSEYRLLQQHFNQATRGETNFFLVSGEAGIGKTQLINSFRPFILEHNGYWGKGKYNPGEYAPYRAVFAALTAIIKQMLSENEDQLQKRKDQILDAISPYGHLLTDAIPELKIIIGEQLPQVIPGPAELRRFFLLLCNNLINALASREHPLVIFLDDLQWADQASLELLRFILEEQTVSHCLFVGTCRLPDVGMGHPLRHMLDKCASSQSNSIAETRLNHMDQSAITGLLVDCLHCDHKKAEKLAGLLLKKTAGLPLFIKEFLMLLHKENHLFLDSSGNWQWQTAQISKLPVTANVTSLLMDKINTLPSEVRQLLEIAACIGNAVELDLVAQVAQIPDDKAYEYLSRAEKLGLLIHADHYSFTHNQVQEAILSSIPPDRKTTLHLLIGRCMLRQQKNNAEYILDMTYHFSNALPLVLDTAERSGLVKWYLQAAKISKASSAFQSALSYLENGMSLLPDNAWESMYANTLELCRQRIECEFITGAVNKAELLFQQTLQHTTLYDRAKLHNLMVVLYSTVKCTEQAIMTGLAGLRLLGIYLPKTPTVPYVLYNTLAIKMNMKSLRASGGFLSLPEMSDEKSMVLMKLMYSMCPSAKLVNNGLLALLILRMIKLSLNNGNTAISAFAYAGYGWIEGTFFRQYNSGLLIANDAMKLVERYNDPGVTARTLFACASFIYHWGEAYSTVPHCFVRVSDLARKAGDIQFASYGTGAHLIDRLDKGDNLDLLLDDIDRHFSSRGFQALDPVMTQDLEIAVQLIRNLKGLTHTETSFDDDLFNEEKRKELLEQTDDMIGLHHYYIHKLRSCIILGYHEKACDVLLEAETKKAYKTAFGFSSIPIYYMWACLTVALNWPPNNAARKACFKRVLRSYSRHLRQWATKWHPASILPRVLLVRAEQMRIRGRNAKAAIYYEQAVELAHQHENTLVEALASERTARFFLSMDRTTIAHTYLRNACEIYADWGASLKAEKLRKEFPFLQSRVTTSEGPLQSIDTTSILKASQALSGEISMDRLLRRLMQIVIENAGVQRGVLLLNNPDGLAIAAESNVSKPSPSYQKKTPINSTEDLPVFVIEYVRRTHEVIQYPKASTRNAVINDPYLKSSPTLSLLCLPLIRQTKLIAILYLENHLLLNAFPPERIKTLETLCTQAAISLENAQLYEKLKALSLSLERRVEERTEELRESNSELNQFAHMISHDLQAPLRAVRRHIELLAERHLEELDTNAQSLIDYAIKGTTTMQAMITDMLSYARISREDEVYEQVSFENMLQTVLDRLQVPIQESGAVITHDPLPHLMANKSQLTHVFQNLIDNAIKFRGNTTPTVHISAYKNEEEWVLSIQDNGIGIPDNYQKYIFDVFQRLHTNESYKGTGIGLAICKKIIQRHGGRIWLKSEEYKGSTFLFSLPDPAREPKQHCRKQLPVNSDNPQNASFSEIH